jgi:hypothetical protein
MEKSAIEVLPHETNPKLMATKPDPKALAILAKSIFRELRSQGYEPTQIVGLATEILSLVTSDIAREPDTTP